MDRKKPRPSTGKGREGKGREGKAIYWEGYPKLRQIFEHRTLVNIYWVELLRLARELHLKGFLNEEMD